MAEDLSTPLAGELIAAAALGHVPAFAAQRAVITRLPGGSVNRTYSVCTSAGRFVLRLSPAPDAWLATNRSVEHALHALAADAGLAPRIVHVDPRDRWLITEFVAGPVWTDASFASLECLEALGDALRRLHAIAPPAAGRFDLLQALTAYVRRLGNAPAPEQPAPLQGYLEQAVSAWQLSGATERRLAVLHHDLHGSNLIDSPSGLVLIDWECAAVNDPLLDIACVLSYFQSARAHAGVLLRRSGLGTVTGRQLAAAVWLFDLHTWLWYRERRLRIAPTPAEVAAEERLGGAVARGITDL